MNRYVSLRRTAHRVLHVALLAVLVAYVAGCVSVPPAPVEPGERKRLAAQELSRLINDGKPAEAIQKIGSYRGGDLFGREELDGFRAEALSRLGTMFQSAANEGSFSTALRLYTSLDTLKELSRFPDWSYSKLYLALADEYRAKQNNVSALAEFVRIPDFSVVDEQTLLDYGKLAISHNDHYAASVVAQALKARDLAVPEDVSSFLKKIPKPAEMISGTVTIWVNRGIKLQQGVGVPDRVIGSGFFIDERGYVITNYHVIQSEVDPKYEGYSRLYIRLPGKQDQRIPAKVVGYDRIFDIALLKVELQPSYVFSFTNIRELNPGAQIYAIGSPGGLENSITSGIISATDRRFLQMGAALQVDVAVNPGNSGGPLVTSSGRLVGIIFAGIPQFEGVNFAIPSFWIQHFLPQLYHEGEVQHSWLGTAVRESDDGLEVIYVAPRSPAAEVGIAPGDILESIDGWSPKKIGEAQNVLLGYQPETLVKVSWKRNTQEMSGLVSLGTRPYSPVEDALKIQDETKLFPVLFGMEVKDISTLPWQHNYVITKIYPGSTADETGLSEKDPFTLRDWKVDSDKRIAILQIIVKKRKAGFLESGIQLASYLELDNFL